MFRLTSEHIGKKVMSSQYLDLKWLVPISFENSELNEQIICLKDGSIGETRKGANFKYHRWGGDLIEWEFYKEENTEIFDFSKFGCNSQYVKDLVNVLDKRYKLKEK